LLSFFHLADLHLGWTPSFMEPLRASQRRARRDDLLRRAVDAALEARVHLFVLAGDIFETHTPDSTLIERVHRELRRLGSGGIVPVTVPGNHDEITYYNSVYRTHGDRWPGILVTNPRASHVRRLEVEGTPVHLYSLAYTGGITERVEAFPRVSEEGFHLGIFHGSLGDWGGERSLPMDPAALGAAGYDYVALGHIHQHQAHRLGSTLAVYPGMVEGKGFDDPGVGFLTCVENGKPREIQVEAQISQTIRINPDDEEALEAQISRHAHEDAVVRVELDGARDFAVDCEALQARLSPNFFHLEVRDRGFTVTPALLSRWSAEQTVMGEFVRRIAARLESAEPEERMVLERALHRGVHALRGERP